jgi:hypothetical protein
VEFKPKTEDRTRILASKNFIRTANRNMDQQHIFAKRKSQMGNLSLENNVTMYAKEMGGRIWIEGLNSYGLERRPVSD